MEEMIDVLDENGIKTGEILTRKEVHRRGLWHKVVAVAIIDENNQILMQQRSLKKNADPGKWDISAAGHISAGQSSLEAAIRETFEEVGIIVTDTQLQYILTYKDDYKNKINDSIYKEFFDCYIAKVKEINMNDIILQESEVADAKLATKEQFKSMVESGNMVKRPEFYKALLEYLNVNI